MLLVYHGWHQACQSLTPAWTIVVDCPLHRGAPMKLLPSLLLLLALCASARGDDADLTRRLEELEKKQDEMFQQLSSEQGDAKAFLNDTISLGGFFDTALSGIWGPDTKTQFSTTPSTFAINLAAELDQGFRFNSQTSFGLAFPLVNREFGPFTTTPSIPQAYLEYSSGPALVIQVGRGYVPFGIAFQLRDSVLFRRRGGPQMLMANQEENIAIASSNWTGLHLSGSSRLSERQWGYDVYTLTPITNPRTVGAGLRLWMGVTPELTLGLSSQTGKQGGTTYEAIGGDAKLKFERLGADAEVAANIKGGEADSASFYVEPYYTFLDGKVLLYAAVDYLDNPGALTVSSAGQVPDPYQRWALGGGLNWLPSRYTRFRIGFLFYDYVGATAELSGINRDYYSLDLSAGVEF